MELGLVEIEAEANAEAEIDACPSSSGRGLASSSAFGLGLYQTYSVERELTVDLDSSLDSSRSKVPLTKPGGYPWLTVRRHIQTESRRGRDEVQSMTEQTES